MDHRLKKQKVIEKVFAEGKTLFAYPVKVAYLIRPGDESAGDSPAFLYTVTVPRRNFKKATERNLLKRRMREAIRVRVPEDGKTESLSAVFIYIAREAEEFSKIDQAIRILMKRLNVKRVH